MGIVQLANGLGKSAERAGSGRLWLEAWPQKRGKGNFLYTQLQKDFIINNKCIKSSFTFWVTQIPSE